MMAMRLPRRAHRRQRRGDGEDGGFEVGAQDGGDLTRVLHLALGVMAAEGAGVDDQEIDRVRGGEGADEVVPRARLA